MSKNRTHVQQAPVEPKKSEEQKFEEQAAQEQQAPAANLVQVEGANTNPDTTITTTAAEPVIVEKIVAKVAPAPVVNEVIPQPAAVAPAPKFGPVAQMSFNTIDEYITLMAPRKPVTVQEGSRNQVALYRAITTLINRVEDDFDTVFAALLAKFEEHRKGAFAEENVFRFFESIELPENDRKAFQRLLNLIKVAGPVAGRAIAVKQVNFNETLKFGLTESGRQRVLGFFSK